MDGRRQSDPRIDRMEDKLDKMGEDVTKIREKIFNGFDCTIKKNSKDIEVIKEAIIKITPKVERTSAERLSDCPLKVEMIEKYEKRFIRAVAVITVIVGLIASLPGWLNLIGG